MDVVGIEPRFCRLCLPDAVFRQGRVALALIDVHGVEKRFTVTHEVDFFHERVSFPLFLPV